MTPTAIILLTTIALAIVAELATIASQLRRIADQLQPGHLQANIYDCTFYDAGNQAGGRKR